MTAAEALFANGVLVCVGIAFGIAVFATLTLTWLWGEFHELFRKDSR